MRVVERGGGRVMKAMERGGGVDSGMEGDQGKM